MINDTNKDFSYQVDKIIDKKVDPISNEKLINKINEAEEGEDKAKLIWQLVINNVALVPFSIGRYCKGNSDQDGMMSDGIMGLYSACDHVRKDSTNKCFSTYAVQCICHKIWEGNADRNAQVYYPKHKRFRTRYNETSKDAVPEGFEGTTNPQLEKKISLENIEGLNLTLTDGEFCKRFYKLSKRHHYSLRKKNRKGKRKGASFYKRGGTGSMVLKALTVHKTADLPKMLGLFRQQVDNIKKTAFVYTIQYLRDAKPLERDEFFSVMYSGRYSIGNPPPFAGWRKNVWNRIMSEEKFTYNPSYYYFKNTLNNKKKDKKCQKN